MAYSRLSSRFPFILLNPQRTVLTVPDDERQVSVSAISRNSITVTGDRAAAVPASPRLASVPAQSRVAVAEPE